MTETDSGSNDDSGQITNPTENLSISYTITFNSNGGSGEMKTQPAESGSEVTLASNTFTRTDYTFSCWATSDDGNIVYKDEAKITLTENLTLYAQWTEIGKVQKVTFSATGEVDYNDKITLSCGTEGATIYYALVAGTGAPTAEEFSLSKQKYSGPITITENAVIAAAAVKDGMKDSEMATATFTVKKYTVTFETAHGDVPLKIEGLKKGDTLGDKLQELTAEGYRFDGWFYGETRFTAETEITSSLTLTAKWTKTYTVTFDANGGTGEMNPQIFTYGEPQNLLPNKFSVDGKEFLGWAKTSGGSIAYDDNSEYTIGAADVTLYAVWGKFVTADNAATVIAGLESGTSENPNVYTVKIISKEESDKDFLREINDKIYSRWREYVKVNLDLSASGITEIPENAFDGANLLGITLPNSLESIKTKAFLETYTLEKIVIPDKVRIIEAEAFKGCHKLAEITLPASLTNIGEYAFSGCDRLETVNYKGTQAQWAQIKIDVYNEKLTGANIVYNYTGE